MGMDDQAHGRRPLSFLLRRRWSGFLSRIVRPVLALCLVAILNGCTANENSIYRVSSLSGKDARVITMDAKQRSLLSAYRLLDTTGKPNATAVRAFCAEPSPDVFSVVAQSLSAGGSFGKSADPASVQAALNLAFSSAEQGSTIPRTQTINMLRELMYRTCERYLSGGYDPTELSLQAIRDQRLMVSILAIEQLTGAVTPKPAVIGAAGSGAAGITGDALIRLDDARQARDKAVKTYDDARSAYDQANGTDKVCDAIAGKADADLSDAQKAKVKPCAEAKTAKDKALADQTIKTATYQELSTLARSGGVSVTTSVTSNTLGGIDQARVAEIASVSGAVQSIVQQNFNDTTETMMFCLRVLRPDSDRQIVVPAGKEDALKSVCVQYLERGVQAAEQRLSAEIATAQRRMDDATKARFQQFWTASRQAAFGVDLKRTAFVDWLRSILPLDEKAKADCFATVRDQGDAYSCFAALYPGDQGEAVKH